MTRQELLEEATEAICQSAGLIEYEAEMCARAAGRVYLEAAQNQIRSECGACSGTGHADAETECEYCGRPIRAIRDLIPEAEMPIT